ncbi:uncharacterized protein LOC135092509 [Scylla paramamosain]|uniref:uncharacterized protein LOC135092509 n=1 Tax=Scylla paramamosain TaxID=85552 RepID=UPI003083D9F2
MKTGTPRDRSAAMARLLLLPLVLLLSLSLGGFPTPTLAQEDCDGADVVVEEGELRIINKKVQSHNVNLNLYMKTESSFEGLSVTMAGTDGTEYNAWFAAEDRCFAQSGIWYELLVFLKIKNDTSTIEFGFESGLCKKKCKIETTLPTLQKYTVLAHGTSRWTFSHPPVSCPIHSLNIIDIPTVIPTCMDPPLPTPAANSALAPALTSAPTSAPESAPMSVMTIISVAIMWFAWWW